MAEFAKFAITEKFAVKFYEAKGLNSGMFEPNGELSRIFHENPETVFCFDGIDEMGMEKEDVKKSLAEWRGKCVISSRSSEYPNGAPGFASLALEPMNADEFLNSRFRTNPTGASEVKKLLSDGRFESELSGNPLFLSLLSHLAEVAGKDETKLRELKIRPIGEIRNRADLYESVVRLVFAKHQ